MIPRRVRLAVLVAFVGHGIFMLTTRYRLSYDAYTHMFFGDHYARAWWSLWEPRWFGGFDVVSYPPLVHQLIGLLSHLTGVDVAYALVAWAALSAYPLGAYAFSRIFCGRAVSGYAALAAAVLPSVYYSAHAFGQLPTLCATLSALFALAAFAEYLRSGSRLSCALSVSLIAVTIAAHHATLLFLPWAAGAVIVHVYLNHKPGAATFAYRLLLLAVCAALAGALVIWPFWSWGASQTIQTTIDHPSRHNFFIDFFAFRAFFLPMYGPLIVILPFALWIGRQRRLIALLLAFGILFLLGLGGTTPLPRWLFGASWEWLTYDRFALWATLLLLPFVGMVLIALRRAAPRWLIVKTKTELSLPRLPLPVVNLQGTWRPPRRGLTVLAYGIMAVVALIAGFIPDLVHTQPRPVDMPPIVEFLAADHRSDWRYLTLGFGDQLAYLSRLTEATTIDGTYFTARQLPELRTSGIGQIDTILWSTRGMSALDPILEESGKRGVRWAFVNRREYVPTLREQGWVFVTHLSNGIPVWENPRAEVPVISEPPSDALASFSWGTLPLLALVSAAALAGLRLRPSTWLRALSTLQTLAIGLLPVSLVFWYFRRLTAIEYQLVYFTYDNALIFLSDALALVAVWAWLLQPVARSAAPADPISLRSRFSRANLFSSADIWYFGLCLVASLSILWSQDWRVSLYVSLHLWLAFGLFLSVRSRPELWRAFALGACTALGLQVVIGLWEFAIQSTAFLAPLGMQWPGSLGPDPGGGSVIQLFDATRLLRAYGSVPHPNILGTLIVAFVPAVVLLDWNNPRRNAWPVIFFGLISSLLVITFSRAAWIGFIVAVLLLAFHNYLPDRRRFAALAIAGLIGIAAAAIPLYPYIMIRVTNAPVRTEQGSWLVRIWLIQRSIMVIKQYPVLGVGAGAYTFTSARGIAVDEFGTAGSFSIEPVHSIPFLIQSELGVAGTVLLVGLTLTIFYGLLRARRPEALLFSAALVGLCIIEIFDHFLWTLAPGRLLFALILGLWAAQAALDPHTQDRPGLAPIP